jgi:hypothetical protein
MNLILSKVVEIYKPYIKCFEGAENCFEVFGIDFMVEDDFNVILIEINDCIGTPSFPYNKTNDTIKNNTLWLLHVKEYVKWIYDNSISKIFLKI